MGFELAGDVMDFPLPAEPGGLFDNDITGLPPRDGIPLAAALACLDLRAISWFL